MQELNELGINIYNINIAWFSKMAIDTRTGKGYVESNYLDILRLTSKYYWNTKERQRNNSNIYTPEHIRDIT